MVNSVSTARRGLALRPTLSQYEHERVNSELSVGKFSLILRSCGSWLGNWIVTTAPCVVTASVTGSHYNCRDQNPHGGNQTSASWYSSSIGHYYSYPDDDMMTLNFSMNREMLKRCIRQLLVTVVTMSCLARGLALPHGHRCPPHIMCHHHVTSWTGTTNWFKLAATRQCCGIFAYFLRDGQRDTVQWCREENGRHINPSIINYLLTEPRYIWLLTLWLFLRFRSSQQRGPGFVFRAGYNCELGPYVQA